MTRALVVVLLLLAAPVYAADLVGDVSDDSVGPIMDALHETPDAGRVSITIDSMGGSVGAGLDLLAAMRAAQRRGVVLVCVVDGAAASMAAVIFQTCDVRAMRPGSALLFHEARTRASGTALELMKTAQEISEWNRLLAITASARMTITLEEYEAAVSGRDWILSPAEALEIGATDLVTE